MRNFFLIIILLLNVVCFSQTATDSLLQALSKTKVDSQKVKIYTELIKLGDAKDLNQVRKLYTKGRQITPTATNEKLLQYFLQYYYSVYLTSAGNYDSAVYYFSKTKQYANQIKRPDLAGACNQMCGVTYYYAGKFKEAMNCWMEALTIYEKLGDEMKAIQVKMSIASLLTMINREKEGIQKLHEIKDYFKSKNEGGNLIRVYNNLAATYSNTGILDSAIYYLELAKKTSIEIKKPIRESEIYLNLGSLYFDRKNYSSAIENYEQAIALARDKGDQYGIANSLAFAAACYITMKQREKGQKYFEEAEAIATKLNSKQFWSQFYLQYSGALEEIGDFKGALKKYQNYVKLSDSLNKSETARYITELDHQYQSKEKQQTIELLNKEKQLASIEAEEHRVLNYFLWAGIAASVLIGLLLYNRYRLKHKANELLNRQKEEIESQHNLLERKNRMIGESIDYAQKIQESFLSSVDLFRKSYRDAFVFIQPKDVVSGDFLWYYSNEKYKFIAIADCTGHGVPGAFMSIVCNNLLIQAVQFQKIECPGKILDEINRQIIGHFESITQGGTSRDGMDISIIRIDEKAQKIKFATAHNSVYLWDGQQIKEFKSQASSIGIPSKEPFETQEFVINSNEYIFLSTDGYYDQKGQKAARKLMKADFKSILEKTLRLEDPSAKEEILRLEHISWRGELPQTDDILVVGFRV